MAEKLAGRYRYVRKEGEQLSRVILRAGDDVPSDLDSDERKRLKEAGLIVSQDRLSKTNLRLPYGHPPEEEPVEDGGPGSANEDDGSKPQKNTPKKQTD
jgi:hypothetical protein